MSDDFLSRERAGHGTYAGVAGVGVLSGGNVQVISTPDGWPIWVSPVRPGREHDTTCPGHHGLIDALNTLATELSVPTRVDLG